MPIDKTPDTRPSYTPENWLSPSPPEGVEYGNVLPTSFRLDATGKMVPGSFHWFKDEKGNWVVPNLFRGAVNDLALTLAAPRNAVLGKYTEDEMTQRVAPAMASTLLGAGLGMPAPAGSSRVFAGVRSKAAQWPEKNGGLGKAATLYDKYLEAGIEHYPESKNVIWEQTGWYKDVDGHWKYEIPDAPSALNDKALAKPHEPGRLGPAEHAAPAGWGQADSSYVGLPNNVPTKLGDLLEHEELFKAYPWLKELPVWGKQKGDVGAWGTYHPKERAISMAAQPAGNFHSTLLHEVQHAVQHNEGFGFGGNVEQFLPPGFQEEYSAQQKLVRDLKDKAWAAGPWHPTRGPTETMARYRKGEPLSELEWRSLEAFEEKDPEAFKAFQVALPKLQEMHQQSSAAFEKYSRLAGEVESRNVQERWDHPNPWQHPHGTPGYPAGPQTLVFPPAWEVPRAAGSETLGPGAESFKGWHGTPHEFEPVEGNPFGEFKDSAIGTGEGAQVYGHGHYVAGAKATAEEYQKNLAGTKYYVGGKPLVKDDFFWNWIHPLASESDDVADAIRSAKVAVADAQRNVKETAVLAAHTGASSSEYVLHNEAAKMGLEEAQRAYDILSDPTFKMQNTGHLLHLEVTPEEEELLHWDKPMREHSDAFLQKLDKITAKHDIDFNTKDTGEEVYHGIMSKLTGIHPEDIPYGEHKQAAIKASQMLKEAGIPGIRYHDQFSRHLYPKLHFGDKEAEEAFPEAGYHYHGKTGLERLRGDPKTIFDYTPAELAHSTLLEGVGGADTPEKLARALVDTQKQLDFAVQDAKHMMDSKHPFYVENLHPGTVQQREAARDWFKEHSHKYQVKTPKQTHNYVIFDPKHIKIRGRNGKLLPSNPEDPFDVGGWPE